MADDRQLRDELEKVQAEVKRLRQAFDDPSRLHLDLRARIEGLTRSRQQQRDRLEAARAEQAAVERELLEVRHACAELENELHGLQETESGLVDATVARLDPGPRARAGCLAAVVVLLAVVRLCW
ncbi:MAG: hypothetical protein IPJ65_00330 [Archangiaceae bacterium]|nr:hypothetical protein [Archangiaceae bacterium]